MAIKGVEVRDLGKDHVLCGEKGLFTTEKFELGDIIGYFFFPLHTQCLIDCWTCREYTGRVVNDTVNGHYVACLEDKAQKSSLGVDAQDCGNEMRFINSYLNIDFGPNVTMRTAYINTYPHLLIVCLRDIEPGEELLLDYGKAYTDAYLTPRVEKPPVVIPMHVVRSELPGFASDSSSDDEGGDNN